METLGAGAIIARTLAQFLPVWIAIGAVLGASLALRRRLGFYGRVFDSPVGAVGFALVLFWTLTAVFADQVALFDPYAQLRALQNEPPGADRPRKRPALSLRR
jgi:peptide/nickel transport system permease protein